MPGGPETTEAAAAAPPPAAGGTGDAPAADAGTEGDPSLSPTLSSVKVPPQPPAAIDVIEHQGLGSLRSIPNVASLSFGRRDTQGTGSNPPSPRTVAVPTAPNIPEVRALVPASPTYPASPHQPLSPAATIPVLQVAGPVSDACVGSDPVVRQDVCVGSDADPVDKVVADVVRQAVAEAHGPLRAEVAAALESIAGQIALAKEGAAQAAESADRRLSADDAAFEKTRLDAMSRSDAAMTVLRDVARHSLALEAEAERRLRDRERDLAVRDRLARERREDLARRRQAAAGRRRADAAASCSRTERLFAACGAALSAPTTPDPRPSVDDLVREAAEPVTRMHKEAALVRSEIRKLREAAERIQRRSPPRPPPPPVTDVDFAPVAALLRRAGAERYESAFREHLVDSVSLPYLTQDDLKRIGVAEIGPRRRILTELERYNTCGGHIVSPLWG